MIFFLLIVDFLFTHNHFVYNYNGCKVCQSSTNKILCACGMDNRCCLVTTESSFAFVKSGNSNSGFFRLFFNFIEKFFVRWRHFPSINFEPNFPFSSTVLKYVSPVKYCVHVEWMLLGDHGNELWLWNPGNFNGWFCRLFLWIWLENFCKMAPPSNRKIQTNLQPSQPHTEKNILTKL